MRFYVPGTEWAADKEEQAKRRLGQIFDDFGQTAKGTIDDAQQTLQQSKEQWARKLFDDMMAPIVQRGQQGIQDAFANPFGQGPGTPPGQDGVADTGGDNGRLRPPGTDGYRSTPPPALPTTGPSVTPAPSAALAPGPDSFGASLAKIPQHTLTSPDGPPPPAPPTGPGPSVALATPLQGLQDWASGAEKGREEREQARLRPVEKTGDAVTDAWNEVKTASRRLGASPIARGIPGGMALGSLPDAAERTARDVGQGFSEVGSGIRQGGPGGLGRAALGGLQVAGAPFGVVGNLTAETAKNAGLPDEMAEILGATADFVTPGIGTLSTLRKASQANALRKAVTFGATGTGLIAGGVMGAREADAEGLEGPDKAARIVRRSIQMADAGGGLADLGIDVASATRRLATQPGAREAVANRARALGRAAGDLGATPAETRLGLVNEQPVRALHGTPTEFEGGVPDPGRFSPHGLWGPGYYKTTDPRVAASYAGTEPGANIRPVDIPAGTRYLDIEREVPQDEIDRIARAADRAHGPGAGDEFRRQVESYAMPNNPITGDYVYMTLQSGLGLQKPSINRLLADAGFDGIKHEGGHRTPMLDDHGDPILHDVYVTFPESLDRLTNALSGRPMGLLPGGRPGPEEALGITSGERSAIGARTQLRRQREGPGPLGPYRSVKGREEEFPSSSTELLGMQRLDAHPDVESWVRPTDEAEFGHVIPYQMPNGQTGSYVPDYLVYYKPETGYKPEVIEIKAAYRQDRPGVLARRRAGQEWARQNGYNYVLVTEDHLGRDSMRELGRSQAPIEGLSPHQADEFRRLMRLTSPTDQPSAYPRGAASRALGLDEADGAAGVLTARPDADDVSRLEYYVQHLRDAGNEDGARMAEEALASARAAQARTPAADLPRLGGQVVAGRTAAGTLAGGALGYSADEEATPEERLRNTLLGAVGGAAALGGGTVAGTRALHSLVNAGRLSPELLATHPDMANRVRAIMVAAADATPEGQTVRVPALVDALQKITGGLPAGLDDLLSAPRTPDEVRALVGQATDERGLLTTMKSLLADAITGQPNRRLRGAERRADVAAVGMRRPEGARVLQEGPPDLRALVGDVAEQMGAPLPRVAVIEGHQPGAWLTPGETPTLEVTRGLLDAGLTRDELADVLAHELAHSGVARPGSGLAGRAVRAGASGAAAAATGPEDQTIEERLKRGLVGAAIGGVGGPTALRAGARLARAASEGELGIRRMGTVPEGAGEAAEEVGRPFPPRGETNYTRPLSDFAPRVHREMTLDEAQQLLPTRSNQFSSAADYVHVSNDPDLALGQGKNATGIRLTFDTEGLNGQVNRSKPMADLLYDQGKAEFVIRHSDTGILRRQLTEVRLPAQVQGTRGQTMLLRRQLADLEAAGWTKSVEPDGAVVYRRPDQGAITPAGAGGRRLGIVPEGAGRAPDESGRPPRMPPTEGEVTQSSLFPGEVGPRRTQVGPGPTGPERERAGLSPYGGEAPASPLETPAQARARAQALARASQVVSGDAEGVLETERARPLPPPRTRPAMSEEQAVRPLPVTEAEQAQEAALAAQRQERARAVAAEPTERAVDLGQAPPLVQSASPQGRAIEGMLAQAGPGPGETPMHTAGTEAAEPLAAIAAGRAPLATPEERDIGRARELTRDEAKLERAGMLEQHLASEAEGRVATERRNRWAQQTPEQTAAQAEARGISATESEERQWLRGEQGQEYQELLDRFGSHQDPNARKKALEEMRRRYPDDWGTAVQRSLDYLGVRWTDDEGKLLPREEIDKTLRTAYERARKDEEYARELRNLPEYVKRNIATWGTPKGLRDRATAADYWGTYARINLLSSPLTHVRNIWGNASNMPWQLGEAFLAGPLEQFFRQNGRDIERRYGREGNWLLSGWANSLDSAFKNALDVWRHGDLGDSPTETKIYLGLPGGKERPEQALARQARARSRVGRVGERFFRVLQAPDVFFRTLAEGGELYRQAYRAAANEGLSGDKLAERAIELMHRPSDELVTKVQQAGLYHTYQGEMDRLGRELTRISNIPGVGPVLLPFIKTPYNALKYDLERSGFGGAAATAYGALRKTAGPGGELRYAETSGQVADRAARMLMGSLLTMSLFLYGRNGNITGSIPDNQPERDEWEAEGKRPYSIKLGDRWVSFGNMPGLSSSLIQTGMLLDYYNRSTKPGGKGWEEATARAILESARLFASKPLSGNVASLVDAIENPGSAGQKLGRAFGTAVQAVEPVSGAARYLTRNVDAMQREPARTWQEQALSTYDPWGMPERRTAWGQRMERDESPWRWVSPLYSVPAGQYSHPTRFYGSGGAAQDVEIERAIRNYAAWQKDPTLPPPSGREIGLALTYGGLRNEFAAGQQAEERGRVARQDRARADLLDYAFGK